MAGNVVRAAGEKHMGLEELSLKEYQAIGPFKADVYQVFDPLRSIQKRNAIGGTSPESVKNQLAEIRRIQLLEKS